MDLLKQLKILLWEIREHDTNYAVRNPKILQALGIASTLGYPCGIKMDIDEPKWPCIYIELPVGQVSWHLPEHTEAFDGHTTALKFFRITNFIKS